MRVLVTGATGYIGGRLVPELLERGHEVRCAARTPEKLDQRRWRDDVEVVTADVFDRQSLDAACREIDVVYMLVHSMDGGGAFDERDRTAAENVRDAAAGAGVRRIVYLGGLGRDDDELSAHLRSRHEVGRVLASGPVPVTELRAAIIIGSGSASFEMLRHLVEVLPVMTTPRWVNSRCQPIALRDVLFYLAQVLEVEETAGQVLEIGGPDVYTYAELMQAYARVTGLRRRVIVTVPLLTPWLSSLWIGLVTPLPTGLARPLVESLINDVVVTDDRAARLLPREVTPFEDAVELALRRIKDLDVATTWAGAGGVAALSAGHGVTAAGTHRDASVEQDASHGGASRSVAAGSGATASGGRATAGSEVGGPGTGDPTPENPQPADPSWSGGVLLLDERRVWSAAPPEVLFAQITGIGGGSGYHSPRLLWEVRGLLDKAFGGIGLRRGRRHPHELAVGDVVDFWRVEALERPRMLRLRAEMVLPGEAWLEFHVDAFRGGSRLIQRARFHPRGLWGRLYWTALVPFHALIFPRMARELARAAEQAPTSQQAHAAEQDLTSEQAPKAE